MIRGYAAIALRIPKNRLNVGAALRAAKCYGAAFVATDGQRYRRAPTDTLAAFRHLPLHHCTDILDMIPYDCVPVAIECIDGAEELPAYKHPPRAFYIFGPEDGTLGGAVLKRCRDIVRIPMDDCMNLAAAVNVVLYDRMAKQHRGETCES